MAAAPFLFVRIQSEINVLFAGLESSYAKRNIWF